MPEPIIAPRLLLFDLDGTITKPVLDFNAIRAEIGIEGPILEAIEHFSERDRARAFDIIDRHEIVASEQSELNDGCTELFAWLERRDVAKAIITRNSRVGARIVIDRHELPFAVVICREDAPPKPDPAGLLLACGRLERSSADAWMIGDGQHDIEAGINARIRTVWLSHGAPKPFEAEPMWSVPTLSALLRLLESADER